MLRECGGKGGVGGGTNQQPRGKRVPPPPSREGTRVTAREKTGSEPGAAPAAEELPWKVAHPAVRKRGEGKARVRVCVGRRGDLSLRMCPRRMSGRGACFRNVNYLRIPPGVLKGGRKSSQKHAASLERSLEKPS